MSTPLDREFGPKEVSPYAPRWVRDPASTDRLGAPYQPDLREHEQADGAAAAAPERGLVIDHYRVPPSLDPTPLPDPWPPHGKGFRLPWWWAGGAVIAAAAVWFLVGKFPFTFAAEDAVSFASRFSGQSTHREAQLKPPTHPAALHAESQDAVQAAPAAAVAASSSPAEIARPVIAAPPPPAAPATQAPARPKSTAFRHLERDEILDLIRRGEAFIASGDLAAARLVLQRAAEAGDAKAALMLASTYDPISLERLGIQGFASDIAQARVWYERAREYGSAEAPRRLETLVSREQ